MAWAGIVLGWGVVPRAHPPSGEHPSLSLGTPHNKMRKPKTLLLLLHRLTCHPGCVTVIADHVIIKRLVGAVSFCGFFNHRRHRRRPNTNQPPPLVCIFSTIPWIVSSTLPKIPSLLICNWCHYVLYVKSFRLRKFGFIFLFGGQCWRLVTTGASAELNLYFSSPLL